MKKGLEKGNWSYVPGDNIKGESPVATVSRMKGWLEQIKEIHNQGKIVAFTHGLAIKYLFTDLLDLDKLTAYKIPIDNTSISILAYENGKFSCPVRNDSTHLDDANLTKVGAAFDDPKM